MKALIQRVSSAKVVVDGEVVGSIGKGLLIFLGIAREDSLKKAEWLAEKAANLRIFVDADDKMNVSLKDIDGEALVVSQFTLCANIQGRRPDFFQAMPPSDAEVLYNQYVQLLQKQLSRPVQEGKFGAKMAVELVNDGPVTIMLEAP